MRNQLASSPVTGSIASVGHRLPTDGLAWWDTHCSLGYDMNVICLARRTAVGVRASVTSVYGDLRKPHLTGASPTTLPSLVGSMP